MPRMGRHAIHHWSFTSHSAPGSAALYLTLAWLRIIGALAYLQAPAAEPADTNAPRLAEHYTKYEHRIPMRDDVRLFTRVYVPKDDSQAWPIILSRTPYALKPYGADSYTDRSGSW